MTQMDYNKRRGYFNFGAGTYLNINGDLGYHILSTEKDKLNIWYSHRSTNGKVKYIQMDDEKVKAKLNDNLGGINSSMFLIRRYLVSVRSTGIRRLIIMDCLLRMLGL